MQADRKSKTAECLPGGDGPVAVRVTEDSSGLWRKKEEILSEAI